MNIYISCHSCAILVTFRPETSEFTLLTIAPFVAIWQKNRHIMPIISACSEPTLTYFTPLEGSLVRMIFQIFVLQSFKGRCYGNQLNMAEVCKRRVGPPLLYASAFDNGLADRKSALNRFNGNNQATSCPNLVNLTSSNLRVYAVKMHNFCHDSPAI